jgi:peptidoglycan/xylan/chitin deacetylase (PgdA/CDA1 family)
MITFDDGYHDVFTRAYPIMKEYHFVGIVGLILAKIDESDYLN